MHNFKKKTKCKFMPLLPPVRLLPLACSFYQNSGQETSSMHIAYTINNCYYHN